MGIVRKEDIHSTFDNYIRDMHSNYNLLINGDFQVWQRGINITCVPGVQYTADRWAMWTGGSPVISNNNGYGLKWVTGGNDNLIQVAELPSVVINTEMTLSFLINIESGTTINYGVDNGTQVNAENHTQRITKSHTGSGTWEKISLNIPKTLLTTNRIRIFFSSGGLQKTILLGYVKLELGSKATPFIPRPYGEELVLCKRYFERIGSGVDLFYAMVSMVGVNSFEGGTYCEVRKRINTPTITFGDSVKFRVRYYNGASNCTSLSGSSLDGRLISLSGTAVIDSTIKSGHLQRIDNTTLAYIDVDAEIY